MNKKKIGIIILFIVQIFEHFTMMSMRTVITPYAKSELLIPITLLGVLTGSLSIASVISRLSASTLMRRIAYLRLLRVSLFLEICIYYLYIISKSFNTLLVIRLANGFFSGITDTAIIALAGSMIASENIGIGLGIFGFSQMIALGAAPTLSMIIYNRFGSWAFFATELVFEAIAFLLTLIISDSVLDTKEKTDNSKNEHGPKKMSIKSIVTSLVLPSSIFPSLLNFFLQVSYASVSTFIILYGTERNWANTGLFYTVYAIGSFAVRPIMGKLFDKKGLSIPVTISTITFVSGMFTLALAVKFSTFLLSAVLMTIGFGGGWAVYQAAALKCNDIKDKGTASATYFLFRDLGAFVGASLSGIVANIYGYSKTFIIFIIPALCGWTIYQTYTMAKRNQNEP